GAQLGTVSADRGPTAWMRPSRTSTVAPASGGPPLPSMRVAPTMAVPHSLARGVCPAMEVAAPKISHEANVHGDAAMIGFMRINLYAGRGSGSITGPAASSRHPGQVAGVGSWRRGWAAHSFSRGSAPDRVATP